MRLTAHEGGITADVRVPLVRGALVGRVVLERRSIQIADMQAEVDEYPESSDFAQLRGHRTMLGVPLLRAGEAIGVILLRRTEVRPFTERQVALLQTFADQAVIAIENVRLFTELEARTAELTLSVGELKALGEVGQAVSSTLDLQTVLDTIVARAVQLSGTGGGFIYEYDDATQEFHLRATHQVEGELAEALRVEPIRLGEGATGRAAPRGRQSRSRMPWMKGSTASPRFGAFSRGSGIDPSWR